MKISVVTVCRNAAPTIRSALESVARQALPSGVGLEHVVVDGASTDGTVGILGEFQREAARAPSGYAFSWLSERDGGLYDAINKGIRRSTGDVVGILHADDAFAADDVIARVVAAWDGDAALQAVYGDVRFVRAGAPLAELRAAPTVRYCTGRFFRRWMFRFATFPAHPATFVRRACYETFGLYSLDYPICADFELMLRLFVVHGIRARYLPLCTTVMRLGGLSTDGLRSNVQINVEDLRALRANGVWSCLPLVYTKYFFKVWGLLRRSRPAPEMV